MSLLMMIILQDFAQVEELELGDKPLQPLQLFKNQHLLQNTYNFSFLSGIQDIWLPIH